MSESVCDDTFPKGDSHVFQLRFYTVCIEVKYEGDMSSPQGMKFWLGVIKETQGCWKDLCNKQKRRELEKKVIL